jgi:hypothetical protein
LAVIRCAEREELMGFILCMAKEGDSDNCHHYLHHYLSVSLGLSGKELQGGNMIARYSLMLSPIIGTHAGSGAELQK